MADPTKPDSRPSNIKARKGDTAKGPSPEAAEVEAAPQGLVTGSSAITSKGGFKLTAGAGQWKPEDVYTVWNKASTAERAQILAAMSGIPGLYRSEDLPPQGNIQAGIFRDQDFTNMSKVLSYSNVTGLTAENASDAFRLSLGYLYTNKQAAVDYFGAPKTKVIQTTKYDEAAATLTNNFVNIFDDKSTEKENKEYLKRLNAAEIKAKGPISAAEKEDILLSIVEQRATGRTKRALAGEEKKPGIVETGYFGRLVKDIRSSYADNGLMIDDAKVYKNAIKGLQGQEVIANIKDNIAMSAKVQYPAFAPYIDQGKTVADVLDPYADIYSQTYGIPRNQVKLSDLKFVAADPTKAMTTEETETYLMKQPAYLKTEKYKTGVKDGLRGFARSLGIG
jgi:hypothetical protein